MAAGPRANGFVYSVDADADFVYSADSVDKWRLVHQWSFFAVWLFLSIGTLLLHCWYSLGSTEWQTFPVNNVSQFRLSLERIVD